MSFQKTAVIGAGSWGTALSILWAKQGKTVTLWGHNQERLSKSRVAAEKIAQIKLTTDLSACVEADLVVIVTPSTAVREIATALRPHIHGGATLLSCTKGIEHGTGLRMTRILAEVLPGHRVAALSGPNLAMEVSRDLPTATVVGCEEIEIAEALQRYLGSPRFRIYSSNETAGIELGGALKNVFAIAAGVSDGFGLGDNSKAALVTRALAEMLRLGTAMGGKAETFYGLSGAGDLIATCFSKLSRNRSVGEQLGQGRTVEEIVTSMQTVAEGIPTTQSAFECARQLNVETPIIDAVHAILNERKQPAQALEELLARDPKPESS
ncbi:MAG: NAD(P)-dependent glycerol-3-phosphate dehydrogenase [Verrucomicrobiota bacterium]|nr:NAD(P)-dependent glycerol-3-phosphate dehydrogenase [Verrucomicrobiota bacterium]